jgi:hypothetical protein
LNEVIPHVAVDLPEIFKWGSGVAVLTLVAMGVRLQNMFTLVKTAIEKQAVVIKGLNDLKVMHEHPDDYDFGTGATNRTLAAMLAECQSTCAANRRVAESVENLAALIRYDIKQRTGKEPPPRNGLKLKDS